MEEKVSELAEKFKSVKEAALQKGCKEDDIIRLFLKEAGKAKPKQKPSFTRLERLVLFLIIPACLAAFGYYFFSDIFDSSSPCSIDNSIFVMEAGRPIADCGMCKGLKEVPKLSGLTPEEFVKNFAYSGRPLVVTDATKSWTAVQEFSYEYFRKLYTESETALNSTEEECQFFPYQTEFHTLRQVFKMSKERSEFKAEPWYVGW